VWPDGIPADEFEGGWKTVYAGIIDSYASRGYPVQLIEDCRDVLMEADNNTTPKLR